MRDAVKHESDVFTFVWQKTEAVGAGHTSMENRYNRWQNSSAFSLPPSSLPLRRGWHRR